MSCDPSYLSPMLEFDPDPPGFMATPQSGKQWGIYALLCGAEPFFAVAFLGLMIALYPENFPESTIPAIAASTAVVLVLISIPCATAGIVFGIIGRNTEGRFYANVGLGLSSVFCFLLLLAVIFAVLASLRVFV